MRVRILMACGMCGIERRWKRVGREKMYPDEKSKEQLKIMINECLPLFVCFV